MELFRYLFIFCISYYVVFKILLASNLDNFFKKGRVREIRGAYMLLSIILSYLLTEFLIKIFFTLNNL